MTMNLVQGLLPGWHSIQGRLSRDMSTYHGQKLTASQ